MNTTPSQIAGALTDAFDISRLGNGLPLVEIRQNYYVTAMMNESDDASIGGININQSGRNSSSYLSSEKEKKDMRTIMLMAIIDDLERMESFLADKYGEDFAENLAAEHLNEETYMRLMSIEDQDERRRQIAIELKKGIDDGSININTIDNPDLKDWIDARSSLEAHIVVDARIASESKLNVTDENGVDNAYSMGAGSGEAAAFDKLL